MKYVACRSDEIPPGGRKIVDVAGRSIGIFNLQGEYFALRNICPHQGGKLCEGKTWGLIEASKPGDLQYSRPGEIITCIWHGWEFDIRTGQSWCDPVKLRVRRYDVDVADGATLVAQEESGGGPVPGYVKGPYTAETFPIVAEGQYLVLDIPG